MTIIPRQNSGFTLVEMVISLVLTSLLSTVVASGLYLGLRSWETVSETILKNSDIYASIQALNRIVVSSRTEKVTNENGVPVAAFYGTQKEMLFVAPLDQFGLSSDLYWIMIYEFEDESGRKALLLNMMPFNDTSYLEGDESKVSQNVIWEEKVNAIRQLQGKTQIGVSNFSSFTIEYLGFDNNGATNWEKEWQDEAKIPRAFKLTIAFEHNQERLISYAVPKTQAYEFKKIL